MTSINPTPNNYSKPTKTPLLNKPKNRVACVANAKLQASQSVKQSVIASSERMTLNSKHQQIVNDLDKKFKKTFSPFLNELASHGIVLHTSPLIQSIFFYIKTRLVEASNAHKDFFSENPSKENSFDCHCLSVYFLCHLATETTLPSEGLNWTISQLALVLNGLNELKENVLSEVKTNTSRLSKERLALIKTKSLSQAIDSIQFLMFLLKSSDYKDFLYLTLNQLFNVPDSDYDKILYEIPQMVEKLLLQVCHECHGEAVSYKDQESKQEAILSLESRQKRVMQLLANFQQIDPRSFDLAKICSFKSLFTELKKSILENPSIQDSTSSQSKFEKNFPTLTLSELISIVSNWERLYVYKYHSPNQLVYDKAIGALESIFNSSLPRLKQRKELEYFKNVPSFTKSYAFINSFLNLLVENLSREHFSLLPEKGKLLRDNKNPKVFLDFIDGIQELSVNFASASNHFAKSYSTVAMLFSFDYIANGFKQEFDFKTFEINYLSLVSWLCNDLCSTKNILNECYSLLINVESEKSLPQAKQRSTINTRKKRNAARKKKKVKKERKSDVTVIEKENSSTRLLNENAESLHINQADLPLKKEENDSCLPSLIEESSPSCEPTSPLESNNNDLEIIPPQLEDEEPILPVNEIDNEKEKEFSKVAPTNTERLNAPHVPKKGKKKSPLADINSGASRKSRNLKKLVAEYGWVFHRATGSHHIFKHPNIKGSIALPNHDVVKLGTARAIITQIMELQAFQDN